jgi:hypothetical protein
MCASRLRLIPANQRALQHGLYAQLLPAHTLRPLARMPLTDLTGEILNLRAAQEKLARLFFSRQDLSIRETIALGRAIAHMTEVIALAAGHQARLNRPGDALTESFTETLVQLNLFDFAETNK